MNYWPCVVFYSTRCCNNRELFHSLSFTFFVNWTWVYALGLLKSCSWTRVKCFSYLPQWQISYLIYPVYLAIYTHYPVNLKIFQKGILVPYVQRVGKLWISPVNIQNRGCWDISWCHVSIKISIWLILERKIDAQTIATGCWRVFLQRI